MARAIEARLKRGKRDPAIAVAQVLATVGLVAFAEYAVRTKLINKLFLSSPSQIVEEFIYMNQKGQLWGHVLISLQEFALGFALSAAVGIGLGIAFVVFPRLEAFLSVFCAAFMSIPKSAILPLLVIWFGIGFQSKVVLIFLFCVFGILFNTVAGAKQTRPEHLKVARVFKATRMQTVLKFIFPSSLPNVFAGLRVTAATAFAAVIFAEMSAAKNGIGYLLTEAQNVLNTPRLFVVVVIVTVISIALVSIVDLVERALIHK
jgi:ABC-type nitrate/sulfonate/bicarbonate transport system permease component